MAAKTALVARYPERVVEVASVVAIATGEHLALGIAAPTKSAKIEHDDGRAGCLIGLRTHWPDVLVVDLDMLSLAAARGTTLILSAVGPEADVALESILPIVAGAADGG
jgi:hypothetical protein